MTIETTTQQGNGAMPALPGFGGQMGAMARAEAAREVARILAQVQVAQTIRRDMDRALERITDSCGRYGFAERAFYSYPKGNRFDERLQKWVPNIITGKSVHLARELAAAFGNIEYGLVEVERDTEAGLAVMRAFAWDLQGNSTTSSTFVVRHVRDKAGKKGPGGETGPRIKEPLFDERDIYEKNANDGARRVRAAIFAIIPAWLAEYAEDLCNQTLDRGADVGKQGKPLAMRMSEAVDGFDRTFGISRTQLEEHVGAPYGDWGARTLARLSVLYKSLGRGDLRVEDVFPDTPVTPEQVAAQAAAGKPVAPARPVTDDADSDGPVSEATRRLLDEWFADFAGLGGQGNRARRQGITAILGGHDGPVRRWRDITGREAGRAMAALAGLARDRDERAARLDEAWKRYQAGDGSWAPPAAGPPAEPPAADVPAGPPASTATLNRLRARFARENVGLMGEADTETRLIITWCLALGDDGWHAPRPDAELSEDLAQAAIAGFEQLAADADRGGLDLRELLLAVHGRAVAARDAADEAEILAGQDEGHEEE